MIRRRSTRGNQPGLLRTMGRTAVIAGTATAVSQGVRNRGEEQVRSQAQQAMPPVTSSPAPAQPSVQQQLEAAQAREISQHSGTDLVGQLQQLADLKNAGVLTDAEFEQAKARILAG
jgi:hypothetical protein